jgi:hypothetical protein
MPIKKKLGSSFMGKFLIDNLHKNVDFAVSISLNASDIKKAKISGPLGSYGLVWF